MLKFKLKQLLQYWTNLTNIKYETQHISTVWVDKFRTLKTKSCYFSYDHQYLVHHGAEYLNSIQMNFILQEVKIILVGNPLTAVDLYTETQIAP